MTESCPYCGEESVLEIAEVWSDHTFLIDSCCEGARDEMVREIDQSEHGRSSPRWLRDMVDEAMGASARRVVECDGKVVIDFDLVIRPIRQADARTFLGHHHAHIKRAPAGWKFGAGIWNGPTLLGLVWVGRPVSRMLDRTGSTLEVSRLCLRRDISEVFRWNACSMLYGWAAKEARRRGYQRIVTYIRDDEPGTSLKAAGWTIETTTRGGEWGRTSRRRQSENTVPKSRWGRTLMTRPTSATARTD